MHTRRRNSPYAELLAPEGGTVGTEGSKDVATSTRQLGAKNFDRQSPGRVAHGFFDSSTLDFARSNSLPLGFYDDLEQVAGVKFDKSMLHRLRMKEDSTPIPTRLEDQMHLLQSVRALEEKLSRARAALNLSLKKANPEEVPARNLHSNHPPVLLTKQDYLNLVDLYYYSNQNRFGPESPDQSPTPLFLEDYSFELSRDFSEPTAEEWDEEEEDNSPLREIEEMLVTRQLREVSVMQAFIDLLLDDGSSDRALFEAYKMFPDPGVTHLPKGVIRLFLQRMSTPRKRSEKALIRYLSLIDDMQRANLRISKAEWSSAIYLAGRSFSKVTEGDVAKSFGIWRKMEEEAGVKATHVTFNILFDIAVRAEKNGHAQAILKEMHGRGLRLNRLGRVSLIYYHGMRGDGDGVRRSYRDFVEAGEVVDTLVLNCVMASLIKAQEPVAAEQIYERMKQLQTRLSKGVGDDGEEALFMQYPPPGSTKLGAQMASNSLGRVLVKAARLQDTLPEHHMQLQASMPLTPNQTTFRSMIAHHASTSGNLDRLTVLMNDKVELFGLPYTSLDFQLLFKGFAVHSEAGGKEIWTVRRLDMVWKACQGLVRDGLKRQPNHNQGVRVPTIQDVNAGFFVPNELSSSFEVKRPDAWEEFILDLAAFPRERLKRPVPMSNAFFPEDADPAAPTRTADVDTETEYSLPEAESLHPQFQRKTVNSEVRLTRNLAIWLIRAYARCTRTRSTIEGVWLQMRPLWQPASNLERDAVVLVLRKALRDCDHSGTM